MELSRSVQELADITNKLIKKDRVKPQALTIERIQEVEQLTRMKMGVAQVDIHLNEFIDDMQYSFNNFKSRVQIFLPLKLIEDGTDYCKSLGLIN